MLLMLFPPTAMCLLSLFPPTYTFLTYHTQITPLHSLFQLLSYNLALFFCSQPTSPSLTPSHIWALFLLEQSLSNETLANKNVYGKFPLFQALLQETSGGGLQAGVTMQMQQ